MNRTGLCDCCDGVAAETPATIDNRPGLSQVAYRAGTWAQFKTSMLDALSQSQRAVTAARPGPISGSVITLASTEQKLEPGQQLVVKGPAVDLGGQIVSELRMIRAVSIVDGRLLMSLDANLDHVYDSASVMISSAPSLIRLKTRADDDFTIALLDSFAVVCDILTFYAERSANEHYLRTATDIVSMSELAKLVGYKPAPGVAASTSLAITIQSPPPSLPGGPGKLPAAQLVPSIVPVPVGLQAQSVPDPGEQPVTFETVAPIEARWGWNALRPRTTRPLAPSAANTATHCLRLKGLIGSIAIGDWLLVLVNQDTWSGVSRVAGVSLDATTRTTLVRFEGSGPGPILATDPTVAASALSGTLDDSIIGSAIKGRVWSDQMQLIASATKLQWNLAQLEENINNVNAQPPATQAVRVLKLDVRASMFGHNAPLFASLPDYKTLAGNPIGVTLTDWDTPPDSNIGSSGVVSLDQTYPPLVADGWVAVLPAGDKPLVMQIAASTVLSLARFMLSAKVTQLTLRGDTAALGNMPIRTTTLLGSTDEFVVAEEPVGGRVKTGAVTLATAELGLRPGQLMVLTGSVTDQSARTVSEVRTIKALALVDGYTRVTFDSDFEHEYDPATVTFNANVAPATHGATKSEILGSGDGAASYQRFALKQPPLTYRSAATPTGITSTLEVRVNRVLWQEVPWLAGKGPNDRVYTTAIDQQGNTIVQFGDGAENGARLPTGQNNVTAKYRQGLGIAGNVQAGQISTLLTRPMGLQGVINPVAAAAGGDPETIDTARRNVPTTTRALDRIVALEDVGDFARSSAMVAKAEAVWAWDGRRHVACVTVAGARGTAIDPGSDPFKNLVSAMRAASVPGIPIVLCNYVPRSLGIGATLTVDPTVDADEVVTAAKAALRAAFGFDARAFMQPVYRSEVFAVLQSVPGVVALTIDRFQLADDGPATKIYKRPDLIVADPPTLVGGTLVGAQLLTLEPGLLPEVVHA
ncbi:MAG TPA: putative baseplate assembly protein [Rhodopila sp.]